MTSSVKPKKPPISPEPPEYKHKHINIAGVFLPGLLAGWLLSLYLPLIIGMIMRMVNSNFNIDHLARLGQNLLLHFNLISVVDPQDGKLVFFHIPFLGGYQLCYTSGNFFATIACILFIIAIHVIVNIIYTVCTHREIIME